MANSKYAGMAKDALTVEIKNRRAAGRKISVDLRTDEDTLRAALDTDDVENGDFAPAPGDDAAKPSDAPKVEDTPPAQAEPKLPPVSARNAGLPPALRNQVARAAEPEKQPTQPEEDEWDQSEVYKHNGDGFLYQVVKRAGDDAFNKPVKARVPAQESGHPGFFWEGSHEEFKSTFTKV